MTVYDFQISDIKETDIPAAAFLESNQIDIQATDDHHEEILNLDSILFTVQLS